MANADFPARTAGEKVLPNGDTVWVQTLNSLLHDQADSESRQYAANKCMTFMKRGADYGAVMVSIRSKSEFEQAQMIANSEWWGIQEESEGKIADPEQPPQGEMDPVKYTEALAKWQDDCKKAEQKRKDFQDKRYNEEIKKASALAEKVRVERAYVAWVSQQWSAAYSQRLVLEVLHRAVRCEDNHDRRYFSTVVSVEDADDAVRDALVDFYFSELATVTPKMVPTSPAAS